MIRRNVLITAAFLSIAGVAAAQGSNASRNERGPRFLYSPGTSQPSYVIDVSSVPAMRRRISLSLDGVDRRAALMEIAQRSGLEFVYSTGVAPGDGKVRLKAEAITVAAALTEVLFDAGIDVVLSSGGNVVLVKRETPKAPLVGVITGRVIDKERSTPIGSVQVSIDGTSIRVYTNEDGRFTIRDAPEGARRLTAKRLGYRSETISTTVGDGATVSVEISLVRAPTVLSEVVSTATGDRPRLEVGNAIGTIKADSIVPSTLIRNMSDLITARTPSVVVTNTSGMVGAPSKVRIRGVNSAILNNDPVLIVDGVRVVSQNTSSSNTSSLNIGSQLLGDAIATASTGTRLAPSRFDDLDPNSIESIDVLRGPSASTLYGTEAANGVIVVKTKRGSVGPWRVNLLGDNGWSYIPGEFPNKYLAWGHLANGTPTPSCVLATLQINGLPNVSDGTCVQDSIVAFQPLNDPRLTTLGTGNSRNFSATMSGGTEQLREFLSLRMSDAIGIVKMSDVELDRVSRMWGHEPPDWMRHGSQDRNISGNSRSSIRLGSKFDLTLNANATYRKTLMGGTGIAGDAVGTYTSPLQFLDTLVYLPAEQQRSRRSSIARRAYGSATATFSPLTWLSLFGTVGGDYTLRNDDILQRAIDCTVILAPATGCASGRINDNGTILVGTFDGKAQASFQPTPWLGLRTVVGEQVNRTNFSGLSARNSNQYNLAFGTELLSPAPVQFINGTFQQYVVNESRDAAATAGWYVEETASLRQSLFIVGALRQDYASAFGRTVNNHAPVYPKASISWLPLEGGFIRLPEFVSSLRLRAAYGHSGQQPSQRAVLNLYESGNVIVDGATVAGIALAGVGNPDLKPERTSELEGGLDVSFFRNERLHLEATMYRKLSKDALASIPLAPSYGTADFSGSQITSQLGNLGAVENRGWELAVNARPLDSRRASWDVTVNMSANSNKLLKGNSALPTAGSGGVSNVIGYPLFGYWGYPLVSYADANNNGILERSEIRFSPYTRFLAATYPKSEITYVNSVALLDGALRLGATVDQVNKFTRNRSCAPNISTVGATCVRGQVDPTTSIPEQAQAYDYALNGFRASSSLVRLSELSLTWRVPRSMAQRLRAENASLTFAGRNLHLWTNYSGIDPNVARTNDDDITVGATPDYTLPQPRDWMIRVNLGY